MSGSSADFGGVSLLELFKLEAESHCATLSDGLLKLEKSPADRSAIEPLMRAAHSVKGAARIVGLDVVVSLAHLMEECFLSAQSGRETLTSARVDQLLKALDVLSEVRTLSDADLAGWTQAQSQRIADLVAQLKAPPPTSTAPAAAESSTPPMPQPETETTAATTQPQGEAAPSPGTAAPKTAASSVRVAANVLNRMLFLAGESTVEASRLQSLRALHAGLKNRQRALGSAADTLREAVRSIEGRTEDSSKVDEHLEGLSNVVDGMHSALVEQAAKFEDSSRRVEEISGALYTEVLRSRMRPFAEGVTAFPRMVRDIARQLGKSVDLRIEGEQVEVDRDILQSLESPLTHMIRNALDHGVENPAERQMAGKPPGATITLAARHQAGSLVIEVRDDGRGIDPEAVRQKVIERRMVDAATAVRLTRAELMEFLFLPGFSTKAAVTELSGRGVGLDVVQSMVQQVSGTVKLDSEPSRGTRFTMRLPVTRSVVRAALVRIGGELFAMPLVRLDSIVLVPAADVQPVQGRLQFTMESRSIGLIQAAEVLDAGQPAKQADPLAVVVIGGSVAGESGGDDRCGLIVDEVCGEDDLVVRPLDPRLGAVPHIAAAAVGATGEPLLVVDVDDLWRSVKKSLSGGRMLGARSLADAKDSHARRRILVVDDSITVREVERQLLMRRGYEVEVAVDGRDGFTLLRNRPFDLLVTDVDMPRMNGIELIRAVRREPRLAALPIIIVSYKDRQEDRLLGMEVGASAYLTKSSFQDESLIRMVEDLIGSPSGATTSTGAAS